MTEAEYITKASALLQATRFDEAERVFAEGLRAYPQSWILRANRAQMREVTGEFATALDDVEHALHLGASSWGLRLIRATILTKLDRDQEAELDLDQVIADAPPDAEPALLAKAHFYRGVLRLNAGRPAQAYPDASQAVKLQPGEKRYQKLYTDLMSYQQRGEIDRLGEAGCQDLQSKRLEAAMDKFNRILKINPQHAQAYQLRGSTYEAMGKHAQALQDYTRSYELDGNEVALFNRAGVHQLAGNREQARADYAAFLKIGRNPDALARARAALGKAMPAAAVASPPQGSCLKEFTKLALAVAIGLGIGLGVYHAGGSPPIDPPAPPRPTAPVWKGPTIDGAHPGMKQEDVHALMRQHTDLRPGPTDAGHRVLSVSGDRLENPRLDRQAGKVAVLKALGPPDEVDSRQRPVERLHYRRLHLYVDCVGNGVLLFSLGGP